MRSKILGRLVLSLLSVLHQVNQSPLFLSVKAENAVAALRRRKVRFGVSADGWLYAKENNKEIKINDRRRGFDLYRSGIEAREEFIFRSYCLHNIYFKPSDVVFDCGANSGDLYLRLQEFIDADKYFAFEPNPEDFNVLKLNVAGAKNVFNLALGNRDSELGFFVASVDGDSSLIEPKNWIEKIIVRVARLDSFMSERNIVSIKLLKLEAEGYEPEILEGLGSMIRKVEYIAVDGGYERGKDCEQTLTICTNYLLSNGFEMVDIYHPWLRALYKNKEFCLSESN